MKFRKMIIKTKQIYNNKLLKIFKKIKKIIKEENNKRILNKLKI